MCACAGRGRRAPAASWRSERLKYRARAPARGSGQRSAPRCARPGTRPAVPRPCARTGAAARPCPRAPATGRSAPRPLRDKQPGGHEHVPSPESGNPRPAARRVSSSRAWATTDPRRRGGGREPGAAHQEGGWCCPAASPGRRDLCARGGPCRNQWMPSESPPLRGAGSQARLDPGT